MFGWSFKVWWLGASVPAVGLFEGVVTAAMVLLAVLLVAVVTLAIALAKDGA